MTETAAKKTGIMAALEVQGRVIMALFLREMKTRFGEKRLGFIWAFLEPTIHVVTLIVLWKVIGRMGPAGVDPMLFLITGIVPFVMFRHTTTRVVQAVQSNRMLLVFPQIQMMDFIYTRLVLEFMTYSIVFIAFLLGAQYFGLDFKINDLLGVIINFILILLFSGGFGMLMLPLVAVLPVLSAFSKLIIRVMYFTSGVFFSIDRLPQPIVEVLGWNPLLQLIHMLRTSFFPQMMPHPEYSNLPYVLFVIASMWLLGMILSKKLYKYILEDD